MATAKTNSYSARLDIDYPPKLNRVTTFFRLILAVPILVIMSLLAGVSTETTMSETGQEIAMSSGGVAGGLFFATLLMILFRQRYPRWWFNFMLELSRFSARVSAYLLLLTDRYPSTVEKQSVHLEIDYPDVKQELSRGLPIVKWLLAFPHYFVLLILSVGALFAVIIAWFAVLFTGRYPKSLFDFVVGVSRWGLRVNAYAVLLVTDQYPPFSLK